MFSHVVLTAPSENIAIVFKNQLLHLINEFNYVSLQGARIHCFADPKGVRIGSGGGTLHAVLSTLNETGLSDLSKEKVLIIHSGGDARRSPMYSVCGKAWMSLNLNSSKAEEAQFNMNALLLLLNQICELAIKCPVGSLVVASSDVLLSLSENWESIDTKCEENTVYVVVVPADISTAKNHGVLFNSLLQDFDYFVQIDMVDADVDLYLQKPSIEIMKEKNVLLRSKLKKLDMNKETTLIDTGLVIFTGTAVQALIDLKNSELVITDLASENSISHEKFRYIRFELYSELLLACVTSANVSHCFDQYLESVGVSPSSLTERMHKGLHTLWTTFHHFRLKLLCFPHGKFLHLGTSREVFDLLSGNGTELSNTFLRRSIISHCNFPLSLSPVKSQSCNIDYFLNSVVFKSLCDNISGPDGQGASYFEHSLLFSSMMEPLRRCFVSNIIHPEIFGLSTILSNLIVQEVPLLNSSSLSQRLFHSSLENISKESSSSLFCLLSLHIDDNTKAISSIGGIPFETFFTQTGCTEHDLWSPDISVHERTLWNATLFPIYICDPKSGELVTLCDVEDNEVSTLQSNYSSPDIFLQILQILTSTQPTISNGNLIVLSNRWKRCLRLSLADLLAFGDSEAIFLWKEMVSSAVEVKIRCEESKELLLVQEEFEMFLHVVRGCRKLSVDTYLSVAQIANLILSMILWERYSMESGSFPVAVLPSILGGINDNLKIMQFLVSSPYFDNCVDTSKSFNRKRSVFFDQDWTIVLRVHFLRSISMIDPSNLLTSLMSMADGLRSRIDAKSLPRFLLSLGQMTKNISLFLGPISSPLPKFRVTSPSTWNVNDAEGMLQQLTEDVFTYVNQLFAFLLEQLDIGCMQRKTVCGNEKQSFVLTTCLEDLAQQVTQRQIEISLHVFEASQTIHNTESPLPEVVVSRAPVRVDLAGGWSDTPPICYDQAGAVLNVAVRVDDKQPLRCVASFVEPSEDETAAEDAEKRNAFYVSVECWRRLPAETKTQMDDVRVAAEKLPSFEVFASERCSSWSTLSLVAHSESPCALPKACVLLLLSLIAKRQGISLPKYDETDDIKCTDNVLTAILEVIFHKRGKRTSGIKIMCLSDLPAGSGMGGSSILAGVILQAVSHLLGVSSSSPSLVYMVTQVEQLMTTGGGWQDQVGGLFPGFKIARSPASLPLTVSVDTINHFTSANMKELFDEIWQERCCLVYTGQQRLAKDTLINALRKYSLICTSSSLKKESVKTVDEKEDDLVEQEHELKAHDLVQQLIVNAEDGFAHLQHFFSLDTLMNDEAAVAMAREKVHEEIDHLAHVVQRYWEHKIRMAPGSDPSHIRSVLNQLHEHVVGLSLCGAGAGGFGVLFLKRHVSLCELQGVLDGIYAEACVSFERDASLAKESSAKATFFAPEKWTVHRMQIDCDGVQTQCSFASPVGEKDDMLMQLLTN